MPLSSTCILLLQEAHLTQGSLALGLSSLRNAQHPDKAAFYSGFFNISIAVERALKLVLVIDHMLRNDFKAPSKSDLKARGHDISELYKSSVIIGNQYGFENYQMPASNSIENDILVFLSEFSKVSRYYNLDALVSVPQKYVDPLIRWDKILSDVLTSDVPEQKIRARMAKAQALHDLYVGNVTSLQHGMDGRRLTLEEVFSEPAKHELAGPYAIVRLFRLIDPLLGFAGEIARRAFSENLKVSRNLQHIPMLHEFFSRFRLPPAKILLKKRWP